METESKKISASLDANMQRFHQRLHVDKSFDVMYKVIQMGDRKACLYAVDGFLKDDTMQKIIQSFLTLKPENIPKDAHGFSKQLIPYIETGLMDDEDGIITQILSGITAMFVDGYDQCLMIDARTYPARGVQEPEKDRVMRGSRDGFVETLVFNTALIRRRIRDPKLVNEILQLGDSSKTDVVISYMEDRVEKDVLDDVRARLKNIKVDALTMNQESLAECLYQHKWYNPFPKFKFSERPDTAAASILEGSIVILVDNSPAAMILPSSVFDIIEEADDYYFPPITGTYLRLCRFAISFIALVMTPLYLLLSMNPHWIPEWLEFVRIKEEVNIPIILQLLILEFATDGLRLASINTPSMLSTPLSVIAGIAIGDYAVSSGWFNSETMLYMAFVVIANYTQASFELGFALKFMRLLTLILTAIFNVWGFAAGMIISVLAIVSNKTIAGKSYIYPLIPFSLKEIARRFFRVRIPYETKRKD